MAVEDRRGSKISINQRPHNVEIVREFKPLKEKYPTLQQALSEKQRSLRWKSAGLWTTRVLGSALAIGFDIQTMFFSPWDNNLSSIGLASAATLLVFFGTAQVSSQLSTRRNELVREVRLLRNKIYNP